ncbi:MAG: hypothetical protein JWM78_1484 [Verrucomicrobiaceae bacterium]|nr:hypothetical protein [Verrucomicrobiaceae bacterium]
MTAQTFAVVDGQLALDWPERRVLLNGTYLRNRCRCSGCRYLELTDVQHAASENITVTAVSPMGYGLQLHFSDGHNRGIYPWSYLTELAVASSQ